jgi:hypothetical protein
MTSWKASYLLYLVVTDSGCRHSTETTTYFVVAVPQLRPNMAKYADDKSQQERLTSAAIAFVGIFPSVICRESHFKFRDSFIR